MRQCKQVTPKFHIERIRERPGKDVFKVSIGLVMSEGWFKRVKFVAFNRKQTVVADLPHVRNDDVYAYFEGEVGLEYSALYYYYFSYECSGKKKAYKSASNDHYRVSFDECFKMSVGYDVPRWAQDAVMYHILPDRFRRGSQKTLVPFGKRTINKQGDKPTIGPNEKGEWMADFYGGDLRGIINSLNYLKKMSVSIIYLGPVCLSQSNHRYDTADYFMVDTYLGVNEDLKELCDKAHQKGMKVVLDAVFNHTGNDSKYFNQFGTYDTVGAYQSKESPYYPFYKKGWIDGEEKFKFWWDFENLPECSSYSEEWVNFICGEGGVIDFWFSLGIDGLRLDVADELSDEFIYKIRESVHRNKKDGAIWGEVWENPVRTYSSDGVKREYLESGIGLDSVMNYQLVEALIRYYKYADKWRLGGRIKEIFTEYPDQAIFAAMNSTCTHDYSRLIAILGTNNFVHNNKDWPWKLKNESHEFLRNFEMSKEEYVYGRKILMSYFTALAFFPGTVTVFYGDEVGCSGLGNIMNRSSYPWDRRDKKLLKFFRSILKVKTSLSEYRCSKCNILKVEDDQFIFERIIENKRIIVAVSRVNREINLCLPYNDMEKRVLFRVGTETDENKLDALGAIVYEVNI